MIDENILIDRLHDNKETKMNISVPSGYYDVARRAWYACIKKVCKLIEEQQRINTWIPCSERLPEEPFGCLVTVIDTNPMTMEDFENILPYHVGYDGNQWNNSDGEQIPFDVIAWQPLPEVYHG